MASKVDKSETELRRLRLYEHWHKDRNEFEQKGADRKEKLGYWKLAATGIWMVPADIV
jgi:hypothetical protein